MLFRSFCHVALLVALSTCAVAGTSFYPAYGPAMADFPNTLGKISTTSVDHLSIDDPLRVHAIFVFDRPVHGYLPIVEVIRDDDVQVVLGYGSRTVTIAHGQCIAAENADCDEKAQSEWQSIENQALKLIDSR